MNFKTIRISLLLFILAYICIDTLLKDERATDWKRTLRVVIYPINADGSKASKNHIAELQNSNFDSIHKLLEFEAKKYGFDIQDPILLDLSTELTSMPPAQPTDRNTLNAILWSMKLRYWSWKNDNYIGHKAHIKAYALYYDSTYNKALNHSTGLRKAKISINYLFSGNEQSEQNNVVILHEILHTLGATDKYDMRSGIPFYPEGYANSEQQPLYPQKRAEIMGGRIAISESEAEIPTSLESVVIGKKTAQEIGWLRKDKLNSNYQ